MTSISAVGADAVRAAPKAKRRNPSLDHARTFLTLVVLLHHAVIPYTYFGHTDPKSWIGFDMIVLATDSFFMAMFFFLSGLFVWPGIAHKAPRDYFWRSPAPAWPAVRDLRVHRHSARLLRHLAAAPSRDRAFPTFWWKTITTGPWPSGPIWFLWVLLAFDLSAMPAVPAVAESARSDQPPVAARSPTSPPCSSWSCLPSPPSLYIPALSLLVASHAGSSSGRSRSSTAA